MSGALNLLRASRFELGATVATPAALALLHKHQVSPAALLARHMRGDWGDLDDEDCRTNEAALITGARLFSAYSIGSGTTEADAAGPERIWIITEAIDESGHRTSTCLLTPGDY